MVKGRASSKVPICVNCKIEMEFIQNWATEECDYFLYQCKKCKKIFVDELDFFKKET